MIRRIYDFSRFIEYVDAGNGVLSAYAADAILDPFLIVVQHVVTNVRLEVIAEFGCMPLYFSEQALILGLDIEVSKNGDHYKDR